MTATSTVRIQSEPFDAAAEARKLSGGRTDVGALVTFTGICRGNEGAEPIAALTLEHYPGMAEAEIERHVAEAISRWPLIGVFAATAVIGPVFIHGIASRTLAGLARVAEREHRTLSTGA